jgi:hypothetical protein
MNYLKFKILFVASLFVSSMAMAQFDGGFGGGFPPMGGGMGQDGDNQQSGSKKNSVEGVDISTMNIINADQTTRLVEQLKKKIERHNSRILSKFDKNKNGVLDKDELKEWKKSLSQQTSGGVDSYGMSGQVDTTRVKNQGNDMFGPPPGEGQGGQNGGHGPNMPPSMGPSSPTVTASAATAVTAKSAISGKTLSSDKSNESAIRIKKGGSLQGEDLTIKKSGDTTSEDESNFYGLNAAVAAESGSTVSLNGGSINTNAEGANAVFAYGKDAKITVENVKIDTQKNSSRGLDATYGGEITGKDLTISTKGAHCAALATDRGEGTVKVTNCNADTHGDGSPGIYSTGAISAENSIFYSSASEAAVIEGKNSINLDNCTLTGLKRCGIMLYQSFSGDAGVGTSSLVMKNSKLSAGEGPLLYCTNTRTSVQLENNTLVCRSGILLQADGKGRWGQKGRNGAQVTLKAVNQKLMGTVVADSISTISMELASGSNFTGAINPDNACKQVDLTLEGNSKIILTADSFIRKLIVVGLSDKEAMTNIQSNGHKLYIKETIDATAKKQQ